MTTGSHARLVLHLPLRVGIHKIESEDEVTAAHTSLSRVALEEFLLEEYLDGQELSVDALSFNGRHVPIAIADKTTNADFIEFGHAIPAALPADLEDDVCRTVCEFLDAVELKNGLSHTELRLTQSGPRVVESHNRRGGDRINTMTEQVCGIDLEETGLAWLAGMKTCCCAITGWLACGCRREGTLSRASIRRTRPA